MGEGSLIGFAISRQGTTHHPVHDWLSPLLMGKGSLIGFAISRQGTTHHPVHDWLSPLLMGKGSLIGFAISRQGTTHWLVGAEFYMQDGHQARLHLLFTCFTPAFHLLCTCFTPMYTASLRTELIYA
jgi:hypothetical protein